MLMFSKALFSSVCCFSPKAYLPKVCLLVAAVQKLLHFFLFSYSPALPMDLVRLVVCDSSQDTSAGEGDISK